MRNRSEIIETVNVNPITGEGFDWLFDGPNVRPVRFDEVHPIRFDDGRGAASHAD